MPCGTDVFRIGVPPWSWLCGGLGVVGLLCEGVWAPAAAGCGGSCGIGVPSWSWLCGGLGVVGLLCDAVCAPAAALRGRPYGNGVPPVALTISAVMKDASCEARKT